MLKGLSEFHLGSQMLITCLRVTDFRQLIVKIFVKLKPSELCLFVKPKVLFPFQQEVSQGTYRHS